MADKSGWHGLVLGISFEFAQRIQELWGRRSAVGDSFVYSSIWKVCCIHRLNSQLNADLAVFMQARSVPKTYT